MGSALGVTLEDARERAAAEWAKVAEPLWSSHVAALAHEHIRSGRSINSMPVDDRSGIDTRDLWDWHVENQVGFAALPLAMQRVEFLAITAEEAVPELGIPARRGRRGHDALAAAAEPLLEWWVAQGNNITATLDSAAGRDKAKPSATVQFLAGEFAMIEAGVTRDAALQAAFKVLVARAQKKRSPK